MSIKFSTGRRRQCAKCGTKATRGGSHCPSPEDILSFAANPIGSREGGKIFGHLLECRECREALAFVIRANFTMSAGAARRSTEARRASVALDVARRVALFLAGNVKRAALERGATLEPDAIAAGLEAGDGRLVFRGGNGGVNGAAWLAEVGIPQDDCSAEWLDVKVSCKVRGREVFDGEFRLCGAAVQIKGGEGRLSREALAGGLADGGVSFAPSGGRAIPGTPVFGELM